MALCPYTIPPFALEPFEGEPMNSQELSRKMQDLATAATCPECQRRGALRRFRTASSGLDRLVCRWCKWSAVVEAQR